MERGGVRFNDELAGKVSIQEEIFQLRMSDKILSVVGRHNQAADQLDW